jgi:hypothetical protein
VAQTDKYLMWEGVRYDSYKEFWMDLWLYMLKHNYGELGSLPDHKNIEENECLE